jgi:hypothetical protein
MRYLLLCILALFLMGSTYQNQYLPTDCGIQLLHHSDQGCASLSATGVCTQGISVNCVGELRMLVYRQATAPTITTTDYMAVWVQTVAPYKKALLFREDGSTYGTLFTSSY